MTKMAENASGKAGPGIEIRMARAGSGWSTDRLAHEEAVGRNTIARIETGATVRATIFQRVEAALTSAGVRFGPECEERATVSVEFDAGTDNEIGPAGG
jgi:DNA-binding XRE family transcriptional regulator